MPRRRRFIVSIHADDEFNLKAALASELGDVLPDDRLAATIIARHRAGLRRRVAGAVGLVIVVAGIGVPLGLARESGGGRVPSSTVRPGHVLLQLAPYTLQLPGQYHPAAVSSAACGPANGGSYQGSAPTGSQAANPAASPGAMAAAVASGACLVMLLTSPFIPGTPGDPNLPRGARPVALGHYHGWLAPHGYWRAGGATVVIERAEPGGRRQDLVITSAGLSQSTMVSLVSAGLS
jgi:hypothetical protein